MSLTPHPTNYNLHPWVKVTPISSGMHLYCGFFYQGTYQDYIAADEEVKQLLLDINKLVDENGEECKVNTFLYK